MNEILASVLDAAGPHVRLRSAATATERAGALARLAALGTPPERELAAYAIGAAARERGAAPASIAALYRARGRGEVTGFTLPAVNIRGLTFEVARALFRAMADLDATAIFEINRAEIGFTGQRPAEFAAVVLAAALAEGHHGPVFLQGDHFQANARAYAADPEAETAALEALVREAVSAQFLNIDIDTSTLVDLGHDRVEAQQAENARLTARLASLVRAIEPPGVAVSIGGEIGEVGAHNSTVEELVAYMDQVRAAMAPGADPSIAKVSVQTGTRHGGVVLPDGRMAEVALDFGTLADLSRVARERYGMAGAVQHGASTLPEALFDRFPAAGTAEVHLATGFQDLVLDHPAFPAPLREAMHDWCREHRAAERTPGESDLQFLRKTRKHAWGPFRAAAWDLPPASVDPIREALRERFAAIIERLGARGTAGIAARHVTHPPVESVPPAA